jgi:lipid A 3-O-deacylase
MFNCLRRIAIFAALTVTAAPFSLPAQAQTVAQSGAPSGPQAGLQTLSQPSSQPSSQSSRDAQNAAADPVGTLAQSQPWEYGAFADGGFGVANRSSYKFLWLGAHAGKVLTGPFGKGLLHGQFEYGVEVIPFWQAYTPRFQRVNCYLQSGGSVTCTGPFPTGGTYTGVSITPIILRWNLIHGRRWMPWIQGAGGLIWTNHKFPPVGPVPAPGHLGTSVFNFTPQFGIGVHYFVRPRQSISISANAVHISSASLGDANPGVNASVQFSIGYTWWK